MKILWTGAILDPARLALSGRGVEVSEFGPRDLMEEDRFIAALSNCDIYVNGGFEAATERVIRNAPSLRLMIYLGADPASYFDLPAARSRGIVVCSTPGANAKSVAELAIGLAISAVRRVAANRVTTDGDRWKPATVHALYGLRIGLLGMGHIAEVVARFLRLGLDADVSYWSRTRKPEIERALGVRYAAKADLIAGSDLICLHLPESAGVALGRSELESVRPDAVLINTARSTLVDPDALYWALSSGRLAHASFDGFYGEGTRQLEPAERRLLDLGEDKFFATAHVGWRTFEADLQAQELGMRSIEEFLDGKPVSNRVA